MTLSFVSLFSFPCYFKTCIIELLVVFSLFFFLALLNTRYENSETARKHMIDDSIFLGMMYWESYVLGTANRAR
jgi:hypothetical protein